MDNKPEIGEDSFILAVENGRLDLLQSSEKKLHPGIFQKIHERIWTIVRIAAENGHLAILQLLEEKVPDTLQKLMTDKYNYVAFEPAAKNEHFNVLQWLAKKDADIFEKIIDGPIREKAKIAAENGRLDVLQSLEKNLPTDIFQKIIIDPPHYIVFLEALLNGHFHILQWLEKKDSDIFQKMIDEHFSTILSQRKPRLHALQWLDKKDPDKFERRIDTLGFLTVVSAAKNGQLDVLQWLEKKTSCNKFKKILTNLDDLAPKNRTPC